MKKEVFIIEDSRFTNVEQVKMRLLLSLPDEIERPTKVQIKITNLDKKQTQLYQRLMHRKRLYLCLPPHANTSLIIVINCDSRLLCRIFFTARHFSRKKIAIAIYIRRMVGSC